ncbi:hypothetical protein HHI36_000295 [Cryptolaemus montrouzieri]|uniref:Beta-glucosidase n=1 Tax=Cryptolaemus montrouzieri TaxID=559131 RepID=A0ABD2P4P7_9CUCU
MYAFKKFKCPDYNSNLGLFLSAIILLKPSFADNINGESFPSNFIFGASTSAYQIEGAWNEDGKGEGVWDHITHVSNISIADRSSGDVACDSYHKVDEDIAMLKHLGVDYYRFSIAWSRIVPNGNVSQGVNLPGVMYYLRLLEKLERENISAMVTIFHYDLPQALSFPTMFIDENYNSLYVDYARLAFLLFGNKVKYWITFNEPQGVCTSFLEKYSTKPGTDSYTCTHNIIKCHAMTYWMYDSDFRDDQKGQVGIVLNTNWDEPASQDAKDIEAAKRKLLFEVGWYAHPLVFGDYPDEMKTRIRLYTFPWESSRLPKFTDEEKSLIKGTLDFIGLNHYSTSLVSDAPDPGLFRTYEKDLGILKTYDPSWEKTSLDWFYVVPFGLRKILNWLDETYKVPIIITENGYVEDGSPFLDDDRRINYYQTYLSNVLDAIYIDHVNVIGYFTWSLMDNWEWTSGYTQKFGLYYVNFSSPTRDRLPKKSVAYYKKVLKTRRLV